MARLPLSGGAYQSRSLISSAQRSVNLYPETNPSEADPPVPVTHYPTPGTRLLSGPLDGVVSAVRGSYTTSSGELFAVIASNLYAIASDWSRTLIGSITPDIRTPVSMVDNGQVLVVVDGSPNGWALDLTSRQFAQITDDAFYGADKVDYVDTFFIFNRTGTNQWYWSLSQVSLANLTGTVSPDQTYAAFDPLDIVGKTGSPDNISTICALHGDIWVLGTTKASEIFTNTGAADSTFARQQGAFIEHGCAAKYSVAKQDVSIFWLSKDNEGQGIVIRGSGGNIKRVSTHAIEAAIQSYSRIDDAIGYCFQQQGHAFYVLTFPTADVSWAFELTSEQWHELAWADANGGMHRHRANCCAFAYGTNVIGDWQNGNLYALDPNVYTDNGQPIIRIRTFPHLLNNGARVSYVRFIADMEVGTLAGIRHRWAGLQHRVQLRFRTDHRQDAQGLAAVERYARRKLRQPANP
jgi:hypothetical protein